MDDMLKYGVEIVLWFINKYLLKLKILLFLKPPPKIKMGKRKKAIAATNIAAVLIVAYK